MPRVRTGAFVTVTAATLGLAAAYAASARDDFSPEHTLAREAKSAAYRSVPLELWGRAWRKRDAISD